MVAAIAGAATGMAALLAPFGAALEDSLGVPLLFVMRGRLEAPREVAIVALDRGSTEKLHVPRNLRDWPREVHARLVRKLTAAGAVAIAFDVVFAPNGAGDADFAAAIAKAGNVTLLRGLERSFVRVGAATFELDAATDPAPELAAAAAAVASFPLPTEPSRVSRFWTFRGEAATLPAVALVVGWRDEFDDLEGRLGSEAGATADVVERLRAARARLAAVPSLAARIRSSAVSIEDSRSGRRLRALLDLLTGDDSRLINFRGPPGALRTISLSDALEPDAALGDLAGRIVFVGALDLSRQSASDAYATVFTSQDGVALSGVEIAATALADLAEGRSVRRSLGWEIAVVFGVAAALGLAAGFGRASLFTAALLAPFVILAAGAAAFAATDLALPVAVPGLIEVPAIVLITALFWRWEEGRGRERLARAVRQYVPESIAASLEGGPVAPGAPLPSVLGYGVCLAADAEGFTAKTEHLEPGAAAELLNAYFERLFASVRAHGGTVTDIAGDGIMCVWAGEAPEKCRREAALAALEMARAPAPWRTRVGIAAGEVMLGAVGGSGRFAATVVGDVANTASRVEGANKRLRTSVLATVAAAEACPGLVLRALGRFRLAGKGDPVPLVEILPEAPGVADRAAAFAAALELCRRGAWDEGAAAFDGLAARFPEDAAARFMAGEACAAGPACIDPSDWVISIEKKDTLAPTMGA